MTGLADDPLLDLLAEQTGLLVGTARSLDDPAVRAASLCPPWSRGHVLTHLARNADGLRNVAHSAVTGELVPMYLSAAARDADVEAGAGRPARELADDVESSAERLAAKLAQVPDDALDLEVPSGRGPTIRVGNVPWVRLREVVYHHVDLGAGYGFADAPQEVLVTGLRECVPRLMDVRTPLEVTAELGGAADPVVLRLGTGAPRLAVSGTAWDVLAWLTGRSRGAGVRTDSGAALPTLPGWG
ncbi:MAG TPA: maleylpyruvate isomerase family mycothiol-dependent enzyme [Actinomycetales bacterium]|nr:maleylpyruvate isomerase family mycothiol-dependent enzyme [Actinomycetales bacterium]